MERGAWRKISTPSAHVLHYSYIYPSCSKRRDRKALHRKEEVWHLAWKEWFRHIKHR